MRRYIVTYAHLDPVVTNGAGLSGCLVYYILRGAKVPAILCEKDADPRHYDRLKHKQQTFYERKIAPLMMPDSQRTSRAEAAVLSA